MVEVAQTSSPEWFTIVAAITDAQQLDDLERAAINALKMALPRHQAMIRWIGQAEPERQPNMVVRALGDVEQYGWLAITPAEMTVVEAETLRAIEQLIITGYERWLRRFGHHGWRQRLRLEIEILRDSDDPDLICRQLSRLVSELIGLSVSIGVVVPIKSSAWLELIALDSAQSNDDADQRRFWPVDTDLSSAVIKLGVPISSLAYLDDCARYGVRPHPDYQTPETVPAYWVGSPIRFSGEALGAVYICVTTAAELTEAQQRINDEAAYYASYLLRPIILWRAMQRAQEQRAAWMEIVVASGHIVGPDRALQTMLEASCCLLNVYGSGLFIYDEAQQVLVPRYICGEQSHKLLGYRLPLTHGIIGQTFAAGKPVIINDAAQDPRRSQTLERVIGLKCYNLINVPFTTPAGVRAVLQYVNRRDGRPFIEIDVEQINAVASLMSLVIDQAQQLAQVENGIIRQARDLDRWNADLRSVLALNRELLGASSNEQLFRLIIDTISQRMQFLGAVLFVNRREHSVHPVLECVAATGALASEFPLGTYLAASRLDILVHEWSFGEHCFLINRRSQTFAVLFDLPPPPNGQRIEFGATRWEPDDLLVVLLRAANREVQAVLLLDQPVNGQRPEMIDLQALAVYASIAGAAIDMALLRDRQQRSLERLTALNGLGMVIHSQSLPQPQVLEMTARGMIEIVNAKWVQIVLFDPERDELRLERTIGLSSLGQDVVITLARRALVNRRPVFRSATTVALPLRGTQRMIGVMVLGGDHALDSADLEVLMLYATQAAIAVESMRLLEEVRRGRDNLARVMAAVDDGLLLFAANGTVIVANEGFYRLARTAEWLPPLRQIDGLSIHELLAHWSAQRLLDPHTVAQLQRSLTASGAKGELYGNDGVFGWTLTQAGDLAASHAQAFLLTLRDMTAAKEAERLRADLTRMVIHDLRNPLNTIMLSFERLAGELEDLLTERQQQAVRIGQNSARQLLNLVNTMLEIGRLESGQMPLEREPLPVQSLIERVVDPLMIQAQLKGVRISYSVEPQVQMLFADSALIARVLQNLLDNALKFSPLDSTITVEVGIAPANGEDQLVRFSDELMVCILGNRVAHVVVRDQGPGIPPEEQEHIFDRFSQAGRRRSEGSGLGLAFCRLAIAAHQGSIWVESEPNRGSAFHFTLPLAEISGE